MYDHSKRVYTPPQAKFDQCSVLHYEPEPKPRYGVSIALQRLGFGRIDHAVNFQSLCQAMAGGGFDLVVSDAQPARGNVCEMVRRVRHSELGKNPFPGIIMVTARPEKTLVQRAINAGPDHLIKWPFTDEQMGVRVRAIVDARRPFVVTFNYIGPDRRKDPARPNGAELITVPNSLRAKARKDISASATAKSVEAATAKINLHRIRACYPAIACSIDRLRRNFSNDIGCDARQPELDRLAATVNDLEARVAGTDYGNTARLCQALASVIHEIGAEGANVGAASFELLRQTGMALHLSFEPPHDARVTMDVSATADLVASKAVKSA